MTPKLILWTVNVYGFDGHTWPLYFETETREQAEHLVNQLGLLIDGAGICKFEEVYKPK